MPTLVPVDNNPFAAPAASASAPKLTPVDHDPFADASSVNPIVDTLKAVPGALLGRLSGLLAASGQGGALETGDANMASQMPDANQAKQLLEENVTGKTYDAKTATGRVASNAIAALADPTSYIGPGGPLRAAASSAAASAFGDTAGEVAKASGASPTTQALASAVAGLATPTFAGKTGSIPETAAVIKAGSDGFDAFRNSGLHADPQVFQNWANSQKATQTLSGLDEDLAPKTHAILDKFAAGNQTTDAAGLDATRRKLGILSQETQDFKPTQEAKAAKTVLNSYMDQIGNLKGNQVLSGNLQDALSTWADARANYSAGMAAKDADTALEKAGYIAKKNNSGLNLDNNVRNQLFQTFGIPGSPDRRGLTAAESALVDKGIQGSIMRNALRRTGNLLGGGGGLAQTAMVGIPTAAGFASGNGGEGAGTGVGLAMLGALARHGANMAAVGDAQRLSQAIRARSPLGMASAGPSVQHLIWLKHILNSANAARQ